MYRENARGLKHGLDYVRDSEIATEASNWHLRNNLLFSSLVMVWCVEWRVIGRHTNYS
jgi:hypothetical protein